jgi:ketosteroid isomerase-like protein
MKKQILLILLVSVLCFTFACQKERQEEAGKSAANVEANVAAIKRLINEWVQLYNAEDFDRLMSVFYAEDPILMAPNAPFHKGKEAILLSYQKDSQLNIEHVDSSVVHAVRVSGNLAAAWGIDTGTTTARSGGTPVKYNLKWLMVFERQSDGTWKCLYEIWNDNPLPETAEKTQQD